MTILIGEKACREETGTGQFCGGQIRHIGWMWECATCLRQCGKFALIVADSRDLAGASCDAPVYVNTLEV